MTNKIDVRHRAMIWRLVVLGVVLLAYGLRWYYVGAAVVDHPVRGDATQYYTYAWNLAHHGVFSKSAPATPTIVPDDYRDPGYPLFLAGWMRLLSTAATWYAVVLMVQAMLGALTVLFAMLLGRYWLSSGWVMAAGLIMAVWPHSIAISSFLLTETLFGFLATLALYLAARACKSDSAPWAVAAGLVFGAAALTNAVLLPFGLLLALFLGWRKCASRRVWVALVLAASFLPGIWMIRNSQLPTQQAAAASTTDRALQNLVQGSWPTYHSAYRAMAEGDPHGRRVLGSIHQEYLLLRSSPFHGIHAILHRMGEQPWRYLAWYVFEKPRLFWGWSIRVGEGDIYVYPTLHSPFVTKPSWRAMESACRILNPWLAALTLFGVLASLMSSSKRDSARRAWVGTAPLMTSLLLLFVTLVYTLLQSEPRYSIPFRSLQILIVISACQGLFQWARAKRMGDVSGMVSESTSHEATT